MHLSSFSRPPIKILFLPALVASAAVAVAIFIGGVSGAQSDHLTIAATIAGLPQLAQQYAFHRNVYYYSSGPLAYALAKDSSDKSEILKYKVFLQKVLAATDYMQAESKCSIHYHLGKIEQLLNRQESAQLDFSEANKIDSKHFQHLLKLDQPAPLNVTEK